MNKIIDALYLVAVTVPAIMAVMLYALPYVGYEVQPPSWVGYTVMAAVGVFGGTGSIIALYGSVMSYHRN